MINLEMRKERGRTLFEQKMVDKMSRGKRPMGHRLLDDQAAERYSEEEYDQDDYSPL